MSFRQLTALISREAGVTLGVTPYRQALWRDAREHGPDSLAFCNMVCVCGWVCVCKCVCV